MSAGKYDFSIEQGTSFKWSLVYKDNNGNPVDLTNWCARIVWKNNLNETQTFLSDNLDLNQYKFRIDGVNGKIVFQLPASITNNFNFNSAKYDLELQSPDDLYANGGGNYTIRILSGTITIVKRFSQNNSNLECIL